MPHISILRCGFIRGKARTAFLSRNHADPSPSHRCVIPSEAQRSRGIPCISHCQPCHRPTLSPVISTERRNRFLYSALVPDDHPQNTVNPCPPTKSPATQTNKTTNPAPASCRLITPDLLHLNHQEKTPKLPRTRELFLCNQYFAEHNPCFSILFTPSRKEVRT